MKKTTLLIFLLINFLLAFDSVSAKNFYTTDSFSADVNIEAAGGFFTGSEDYSGKHRENINWGESYLKFGLGGQYKFSPDGIEIYGAASAMHTAVYGDGDLAGFSDGSESRTDLEDGYLGIKYKFSNGMLADFSMGAQQFQVGDGFLIYSDFLNLGKGAGEDVNRGGAYWLAARKAFRKTMILKLDTPTPYRMDGFYLGSENPGNGDLEIAGLNVEYLDEKIGTLGFTYFKGLEVDKKVLSGSLQNREGLDTYSIRGQGNAGFENLFLSAEYVYQTNDGEGLADVSAHAWYTEVGYTFSKLPLSPKLTYRYSFFTGNDPNTGENEAFDPLFYGFSRGFGTWYQGEIAGNYTGPFNTNAGIHHAGLALRLRENIKFNLLYFKFVTDEPAVNISDNFGEELNFILEWQANDYLYISPTYGVFLPGDGGKASLNSVNTSHYFQLFFILSF